MQSFIFSVIWYAILSFAFPDHTWPQFFAALAMYLLGFAEGVIRRGSK